MSVLGLLAFGPPRLVRRMRHAFGVGVVIMVLSSRRRDWVLIAYAALDCPGDAVRRIRLPLALDRRIDRFDAARESCRETAHSVGAFLCAMSREAAAAGISRTVIDSAFAGLTQDGAVLAFDRRQRGTFRKNFEEYAATRVVPARINRARQLMQRHAALLARIERQFGVPATLLMAIWTLESDNGSGDMGKLPVIRTLATLAHSPSRWKTLLRTDMRSSAQRCARKRPARGCGSR
jgi:membrane-bound lytic murein transglycosylase B